MRVLPVLSVCLMQLLTQRVAAGGLVVEFNQDWVVDTNTLLLSHDAAASVALLANKSLLAADDDAPLTDRDYFLLKHPGGTWPWDNEGPVEVTDEDATMPEDAPMPEDDVTPDDSTMEESTAVEPTIEGSEVAVSLASRALGAYPSEPDRTVACLNTASTSEANRVSVLVLVSDCSIFDTVKINQWVKNLRNEDSRYFNGGRGSRVTYVLRCVSSCGNNLPRGFKRFEPSENIKRLVAVVGFVTQTNSYNQVVNYVTSKGIKLLIGFKNQATMPEPIPGFHPYSSGGQLDSLNPFSTIRMLHCAGLPNGVPTSYVRPNGQRACYCSCPTGFEMSADNKCVPITEDECECKWSNAPVTFEINPNVDAPVYTAPNGKCLIKNLGALGLTRPDVGDNYVSKYRTNADDTNLRFGMTGPHIELSYKRHVVALESVPSEVSGDLGEGTTPVQNVYSWKNFQEDTMTKVNLIELKRVGKYEIELQAADYGVEKASCDACVTVVDKWRPRVNPLHQCETNCARTALTKSSLNDARTALGKIVKFKTEALNDPCGINTRCDDDKYELETFMGSETTGTDLEGVGELMDDATVKDDLVEKLSVSPFADSVSSPPDAECSRCVAVSTWLKEWWSDYKCGSDTAASKCEGLDHADARCSYKQCVKVSGTSLAVASAEINPDVKTSSKNVVKHLVGNSRKSDNVLSAEYKLGNSIHVALECSEFPKKSDPNNVLLGEDGAAQITEDECTYSAKVSKLIDIDVIRAVTGEDALFSTDEDVSKFVHWRYKYGDSWKTLTKDGGSDEVFTEPKSDITVEARTNCGLVAKFDFHVHLHLNNKIKVCEYFSNMWYQTTTPALDSDPNAFCMFPKSDFAEVTFDYRRNIGLDFKPGKFQMSISRVQCWIKYAVEEGEPKVDLFDSGDSVKTFDVVEQFAIDGRDTLTTGESTTVSVTCEFTYSRKTDDSDVTHRCPLDLTIKDCSPPTIDEPCVLDGKCDFNKCSKEDPSKADLFQACGGTRVTQNDDGAAVVSKDDVECCESCTTDFSTACVAIQEPMPGFNPIKRCEAVETPPPQQPYRLLANAVSEKAQALPHAVTALLGASAMVAVVALVVVVRRRAVAKAAVEDEAYYALLG